MENRTEHPTPSLLVPAGVAGIRTAGAAGNSGPRPVTVVDHAEAALRAFGNPTRAEAEALLRSWQWSPDLSRAERAEILARFGGAA